MRLLVSWKEQFFGISINNYNNIIIKTLLLKNNYNIYIK